MNVFENLPRANRVTYRRVSESTASTTFENATRTLVITPISFNEITPGQTILHLAEELSTRHLQGWWGTVERRSENTDELWGTVRRSFESPAYVRRDRRGTPTVIEYDRAEEIEHRDEAPNLRIAASWHGEDDEAAGIAHRLYRIGEIA